MKFYGTEFLSHTSNIKGYFFFLGNIKSMVCICQDCHWVQLFYRPGLPLLGEKGTLCLVLLIQEVAVHASCSVATQTHSRMIQWRIQRYRNNNIFRLLSSARSGSHPCFQRRGKKTAPHIQNPHQKNTRPNFLRTLLKIIYHSKYF